MNGLDNFRQSFHGEIVLPSDPAYHDARRVWNGMIDRRPAMVVRPTGSDDVVAAIRFARDSDLLIAVRGGGHSMPGHGTCDDGVVIDLSHMRGATVDPEARLARVNGGALLGELDVAAQAYGLVCPVGVVSHTGVGGLTLGGGMGRLQRKHGFTIDNLQGVDVVTADGRLVHASADENGDLFWALRGAGANFGVVTSFEFKLHPYDGVLTVASVTYPMAKIRDAWALYRNFSANASDDTSLLTFGIAVAGADGPEGFRGQPVVTVSAFHSGDQKAAERELQALATFGEPIARKFEQQAYIDVQRMYDEELGWGHRIYTKGGFTDDLPDEALDRLAAHFRDATVANGFGSWAQGGAVGRLPEESTAFTGRSARFQMSSESSWDDPAEDERHIAWGRAAFAIVEPFSRTGRYVNDVSESGGDLGRWIYGDEKYDRLVAVKRAWDPDNVFRLNQNIKP
jgi:FAD/FMN-containing dehydrogenase